MEENNLKIKQTLGLAYENHKKGNLKLAQSLYEKVLKIDSNHFETIFLLGSLFLQTRNFHEAINFLNKAISIQPQHANSYQNLGYAFIELGEFEKAKELFLKAIEIQPNHGDAYFNLANAYKQMRNFKKAQEIYKKTIQIQPKNSSIYNNYGNVCKQLGDFEEAINSYNKAIELKPDHPRAHHNLGNTYNQLGQYSKAINSFKNAFQYQPFNLESLYNWSDLDEGILNSKLKEKINLIMKNKQLPKKDLAYGNFLLAKYELEKRNFENEFNYLVKGHLEYFYSKKTFFEKGTNYWLNDLPKNKEIEILEGKEIDNYAKPIFIIGVPRCGSTVVEKVIASGARTIPIGEECGVISAFVGDKILKQVPLGSDTKVLKEKINDKYNEIGLIKKESDYIFTDKTLDNFFFLELIKKVFPKAKIINCKRNPTSSIMSILKNNLGDVSWAHQLESIFLYFEIYNKKITHFKSKYPDFIYDLEFESFQNNPENESKKLMEFCELPWDKKCLEFHKRKDIISYTASHRQIRKPIYKVSEDKNKPYKEMLSKYGSKYNWYN
tara:strand:+ start:749 stop:2404 length:1656 start_codon:yes stop_codon:yes gene_type:complete